MIQEVFKIIKEINEELEYPVDIPLHIDPSDLNLHFVGTSEDYHIYWLNEVIWDSMVEQILTKEYLKYRMQLLLSFFNQITII